jgi:probable HAF family extracellular repeat protein
MQDLGTLPGDIVSSAINLNDRGEVVGVSSDANFHLRAWVLRDGVPADLNTLIQADFPLHLLLACSINSRGEIIGLAVNDAGEFHGYLASPAAVRPE